LIRKLSKNNVVSNPLSQKKEQKKKPLQTTQIFNAMFVGENNLKHKIMMSM
jgi:hypothetical protein